MRGMLGRLRLDKRGGTSVEYALIAVLISAAAIPAFLKAGSSEREILHRVNQDMVKVAEPGVKSVGSSGVWISKSTSSR